MATKTTTTRTRTVTQAQVTEAYGLLDKPNVSAMSQMAAMGVMWYASPAQCAIARKELGLPAAYPTK